MRYFWITVKHKWCVFLASLQTGLPLWLTLVHDLSKFTRHELPHYDRQFFGDKGDPEGFAVAWHHHIIHNPHHPEHWTYIDKAGDQVLPMPPVYVKEMVTDWLGASRAYTGSWDMTTWLDKNLSTMHLHPETWRLVGVELSHLGYCTCDGEEG